MFPRFYRADAVGSLYLEDVARVEEAAEAYRTAQDARPASEDRVRTAVLAIDCQVAFCVPGASLFVPGAVEDTRRAIEWLYLNLTRVTTLVFTLDTHSVFQVFHPAAWVDEAGRHPAPFTVITAADVRAGRRRPVLPSGRLRGLGSGLPGVLPGPGERRALRPHDLAVPRAPGRPGPRPGALLEGGRPLPRVRARYGPTSR